MRHKDIRRECEELWAKNKYFVLSKSHKAYLEIRGYLRGTELDVSWLNEKIQETRDMKESKKEYMEGKNNQKVVIECINTLLKKYPNEYLEKSTLLTGEQYETMA